MSCHDEQAPEVEPAATKTCRPGDQHRAAFERVLDTVFVCSCLHTQAEATTSTEMLVKLGR